MDDRYTKLEEENKILKHKLEVLEKNRRPLDPMPIRPKEESGLQRSNNPLISSQTEKLDEEGDLNLNENMAKFLQYLKSVLGYTIKCQGSRIFLRSIYAFCEEDIFEIEIKNNKIIFHNTDYLEEWSDYINTYVKAGRSYAAFFAAVTLDLFNKRTFG